MATYLERRIQSSASRLVIVAPSAETLPAELEKVVFDTNHHQETLADIQRFRGAIYVSDGALRPTSLTADGRHWTAEDEKSWHVGILDDKGELTGCIWYLEHTGVPHFEDFRLRDSALGRKGSKAREQLTRFLQTRASEAQEEGVHCAEVGGWAVAPGSKQADSLAAVLAIYALSQLRGGAHVMATATQRHGSASILQRLGGEPVQMTEGEQISPYYDERYRCTMELLEFDTRRPPEALIESVEIVKACLANIPVLVPASPAKGLQDRPEDREVADNATSGASNGMHTTRA